MSVTLPESTEFQSRYLDTVRGWNYFEISKGEGAEPILDVDLAPERAAKFRVYERIEDIRSDLEDLAGSIPSDEPDRPAVEQTFRANLLLLRAMQGEEFPFEDYVEGTIGFRPEPVGPDEIDASAQRLDELLRYGGLAYDAESGRKYQAECVLTDEEEIKRAVEAGVAAARYLAAGLIDDVSGLDIDPIYIKKDEYGVSSLTKNPDGTFRWEVNVIPERHRLDRGRINTIAAHEITGHALHMLSIERSIQAGILNPILGATGVHMPYAFHAEALAQNAEFEFLDSSWLNAVRARYNEHAGMVFYDAQWRVNHGEDPEAVAASIKDEGLLPFEPEEFYNVEFMKLMRDHPLYRTYLAAYHPALQAMGPLRTGGIDTWQRKQVLETLYDSILTPGELTDVVAAEVAA